MVTLEERVLQLLRGVADPALRMEVMRTIVFFESVLASGSVSDEEVYNDVKEVVRTVIMIKEPGLEREELERRAEEEAKEIFDLLKARAAMRRVVRSVSARSGLLPTA